MATVNNPIILTNCVFNPYGSGWGCDRYIVGQDIQKFKRRLMRWRWQTNTISRNLDLDSTWVDLEFCISECLSIMASVFHWSFHFILAIPYIVLYHSPCRVIPRQEVNVITWPVTLIISQQMTERVCCCTVRGSISGFVQTDHSNGANVLTCQPR